MAERVLANANAEKRLFISLITRDISLVDAFLDIVDNSINAAIEPMASSLEIADDYQKVLDDESIKPKVQIHISIGSDRIVVLDDAGGISAKNAINTVFKFGRAEAGSAGSDRLSVYGVGLKRAMFKLGNTIHMVSDHVEGGFELNLDVNEWEKVRSPDWTFSIETRDPNPPNLGTKITVSDLNDDVLRRLNDGLFENQLIERMARTYSFFIGRLVEIFVNSTPVEKEALQIGDNHTSERFESEEVSCTITAGIAVASGDRFREKNSGWFIFCNGRTVLFSDTSMLTGWGEAAGLPLFQPKHRPFLGTVFFVSSNPEALPWTTTKASINQESRIWQEAKGRMIMAGRLVTRYLDSRYGDSVEAAPSDLKEASGATISVLSAATSEKKEFRPPPQQEPRWRKIQYTAKVADIKRIESHLRRPGMGGSQVGRYTFDYFLKIEVGGDE